MQVNSFGSDLILAEACRDDVSKFCKNEKPGQGRVHDCLRKHRQQLSPTCRKEELKLEIEESSNFELKISFMQVSATLVAQLVLAETALTFLLACSYASHRLLCTSERLLRMNACVRDHRRWSACHAW